MFQFKQHTMLVILLLPIETVNNMQHNSCNVNFFKSILSNYKIVL